MLKVPILHESRNQNMRWNCEKNGCYKNQLPDYQTILSGCFGMTSCRPMDVDGIIERNGKILFIESKYHNIEISQAQKILFRALINAGHSILVVWMKESDGSDIDKIQVYSSNGIYKREANKEKFRDAVKQWWDSAEKRAKFYYVG